MTGRFPDLARFLNNDEGVTTPEFVVLTAIVLYLNQGVPVTFQCRLALINQL